ncbi:MAG: hypothetical protein ABWX94_00685, partial [Candidatus Saccharimonadales bacterium]
VAQFFQAKQLSPDDKDSRSLRTILREAKQGKQADQAEVNAAMGRSTRYLLPALVFIFTIQLPSALSLYWLVSGLVAFLQQSIILRDDTTEMAASTSEMKDKKGKKSISTAREKEAIEAEIVEKPTKKSGKKTARTKKRRK